MLLEGIVTVNMILLIDFAFAKTIGGEFPNMFIYHKEKRYFNNEIVSKYLKSTEKCYLN